MIKVLEAGLSTTIQDAGRYGHYHIGMPPSGAMDQFAHTVANYLVGNDKGAATVEMTYQGSDFKFTEDTVIAITGAEMAPELNGEPVSMWETLAVSDGDVLSLQFATNGARTYLAVAGGIDVTPVMESRSTYTLVGIGGYDGRTLEDGDTLTIGDAGADRSSLVGNSVADEHIPNYDDEDHIRIVLGLCDYRLTDESKEELCDAEWTVTPEADRVGYRLEGPEIEFKPREQPFGAGTDPSNVVDLGYPVGSIQVPQKPIVLMRDAVTGGGYATVGTVISTDRDLLSQRRTHQPVYFQSVTLEEALAARKARTETLESIRNSLTP
ncbi:MULTISPECIES: biotin-dependent carboxyltransferase family protein [Haloferax]|uniref:5-oxoprolinase/urea amidolyase family protein n=2 Tax=Haloferax TaxID=2251 RepID=A0A6G1Z6P7_9EURY|nr:MULTISPECIES: biotin-dependent carboxyltransferase family protein [Haloferax]KAB1185441.1 biotin-dependent carboxyltransferase [Haloferax sp. CBA1149]MRW82088.1 5-oxoprolinase/urea amidolyase family protein [Haloferax marinisediminis]